MSWRSMGKFLRSLLQILCTLTIAVGCVTGLCSLLLVGAMLLGWAHDGRLVAHEARLLTKSVAVLVPSSLVIWLAGFLYRRFIAMGDDSFRLVRSSSGRQERSANGVFDILFFAVFATVLFGLIPASPLRIPTLIAWLLVAFVGLHAHIFLHEFGHLFLAAILRFKLAELHVGLGTMLAAKRLPGGVRIVWRLWPLGGFAHASDRGGKNPRIRQSLFVIGGPLADVTVLALGYGLITRIWGGFGEALTRSPGGFVTAALLFRVFVTVLNGLIPQTVWIGGRTLRSDAWLLWRTWFAPRGVIGFAGDPSWLDVLSLLRSPDPDAQLAGRSSYTASGTASEPVSFRTQQLRLQSRIRPGGR